MMNWYSISVAEMNEGADKWNLYNRLDRILDDYIDSKKVVGDVYSGSTHTWSIRCTRETFLEIVNRLYGDEVID